MTIAELISVLSEMDSDRLVVIQHPDESRGYYPAADDVWQTTVSQTTETGITACSVVVLEFSPWPKGTEQ